MYERYGAIQTICHVARTASLGLALTERGLAERKFAHRLPRRREGTLRSKLTKFAILAGVCLLGSGAAHSAHAQAVEWSGGQVIHLGGLPGSVNSLAYDINDAGQVVGVSCPNFCTAVEWSGAPS